MNKETKIRQLPVELFKQSEGFCGPASLKMILAYYGVAKTEEELANLMGATREYGCDPTDIILAAERLGFSAHYKEKSSIEEIASLIDQKIPVIVQWFSPEENGHYSVISGYENDDLIMVDPLSGSIRKMASQNFLNRWFELDSYPPQNPANFKLREIIVVKLKEQVTS